ncbi:hypothetical protein [Guggenheimella bovis]
MKKTLSILLILALVLVGVVACQQKPAESQEPAASSNEATSQPAPAPAPAENGATLKDGTYFATGDNFDEKTGWKDAVLLVVKDGKVESANWNAISNKVGYDKKTAVKLGKYPMVAAGKAQADWDVQAKAVEDYFVANPDPEKITYKDNEGHTDAISGVSIHVNGFFDVAKKALAQGPVEKGPYTDGSYHAEDEDFGETGWKEFVDVTVMNGNIVSVKWNGLNKDNPELDKLTAVKEGKYPMVAKGGAKAEWDVQAQAVESFLLEKQDLASITYSDAEGHTDAISGVSIHVKNFFELVKKALGM